MRFKAAVCVTPVALMFALASLSAQQGGAPLPPVPVQPRTGRGSISNSRKLGHQRRQPCWKQVGIPERVVAQRKQIRQNTHSQIMAVCSDSSLSEQQQIEKIRQIRHTEQEQISGLLTPAQRDQLKQCELQRGGGRAGQRGGGRHAGSSRASGGPCAEFRLKG